MRMDDVLLSTQPPARADCGCIGRSGFGWSSVGHTQVMIVVFRHVGLHSFLVSVPTFVQEKVTIRAKKLVKNNLLRRRQFIIDVIHPGKANVSKADLKVRPVVRCCGCE